MPLVATLRGCVGLEAIATEDDAATARRVLAELHRRAFQSGEPRGKGFTAAALLVVDNVDDPGLIAQPQLHALHAAMREAGLGTDYGWLHLLATTRLERHQLPASRKADSIIPVDALPEADAIALWTRLLADEPGKALPAAELDAARAIFTLLERHTLAVEITARHLRRSFGETAVSYLKKLRAALAHQPWRTSPAAPPARSARGRAPSPTCLATPTPCAPRWPSPSSAYGRSNPPPSPSCTTPPTSRRKPSRSRGCASSPGNTTPSCWPTPSPASSATGTRPASTASPPSSCATKPSRPATMPRGCRRWRGSFINDVTSPKTTTAPRSSLGNAASCSRT